jgi:subtilisin family serine protease
LPAQPGRDGCATTATSSASPPVRISSADVQPLDAAAVTDAAEAAVADAPGEGARLVVTSVDSHGRPHADAVASGNDAGAVSRAGELARRLTASGRKVVGVDHDVPVVSDGTSAPDPYRSIQWALDELPFESLWSRGDGARICVAVLDSGVQTDHPDLAGKVVASQDETGEGLTGGADHATHVAGIIAAVPDNGIGVSGAAPGAELLDVKVLGSSGTGYSSWVASGIVWAVDHGAAVINLSLGSSCGAGDLSCLTTAMEEAVQYAEGHGVLLVAAAGNNGDPNSPPSNPHYNWWSWPAAMDWPIAVASTTSDGTRSASSTTASYVDVAAPGEHIASTAAGSSYLYMTGTSMAAPYVSALAALVLSAHPEMTAAQLRARIVSTATDIGSPGVDDEFGAGLIDPAGADS